MHPLAVAFDAFVQNHQFTVVSESPNKYILHYMLLDKRKL